MRFIMGMRIPSSGAVGSSQSVSVSNWQQRQQNFKDLFSAVQSGDLSGAQKAFAGLTAGATNIKGNSPLAQIGQALQNGDIAGAQKAAQQLQANRGGHHHHAQVAATQTPTSGSGSLLSVMA
jgi:hypothetical protein